MSLEALSVIPDTKHKESGLKNLQERRSNYHALAGLLGNPNKLFYPAGRRDIGVVTPWSVEVLAITDVVPFLFSEGKQNNTYSSAIHSLLEANNGQFIALPDIIGSIFFGDQQRGELVKNVQKSKHDQLLDASKDRGFVTSTEMKTSDAIEDSFAHVLAGITLIEGDLTTAQVGKFGDDFRIQFDIHGRSKTVIFRQARIDSDFSTPGSENWEWAQRCFEGFNEGKTALVVKADIEETAEHVVNAVTPNVIYGFGSSMTRISHSHPEYTFVQVDSNRLPFPKQRDGYGEISDVLIATREDPKGRGEGVSLVSRLRRGFRRS